VALRRTSGLWMLAILLSAGTDDTRPVSITVEQAVDEAVHHNLSILAEQVNLTIAEASLITARLRPNPVLSLSADHLDLLGTRFNPVNGGGPTEVASRIDIPVERAHKREYRMETAGLQRQIAEARLTDSIRRLRLQVSIACINVIQAKANLALARENLQAYEELARINESKVQAGSVSMLELVRSRVAMLQFRSNVKRALLELATAKTKLQNLLGRKTSSDGFDIIGDLKIPLHAGAMELTALQQSARSYRPDVQSVKLTQARSEAELKLQLAQGKVDYTYGAEYRRQQGVNGTSNSVGVFVSVPLPVHNRNQGEIARVRAEQEQLTRQIEAVNADASTEVTTAYEEFVSARDLVESIERELLGPAQKARETAAYIYRAGASSLIEFLDAQRAFNETMQSYHEAQADYRRAVIQLNASVGQDVIP
jgi:outer membrane protein, heavy metal efflux system